MPHPPATAANATTAPSACPVCAGAASPYCERENRKTVWRIDRCASCGHGFVANRPSLAYLADFYSDSDHCRDMDAFNALADAKAVESLESKRDARTLAEAICRLTPARGRSLDVGCGTGVFSLFLSRAGFRPLLVDFDARAERLTRLIPGSEFRLGAFEAIEGADLFDAIIMSQVLEHALDPIDWLRHAQRLLAPGGVLAIAVPNFAGLYRVLGQRDPFIEPPLHLNYFTPRSMRLAIEKCGLRCARIASCNELSVPPGGAKAIAFRAWNALSRPLDATPRGIILRAYARKPA